MSGVKIIGKHREGCLTGDKPRTYVMGEVDFRRDKIGRKGGSTAWWVFSCNDLTCPARLLIRWDVLSDFLDAAKRASEQRANAPASAPLGEDPR